MNPDGEGNLLVEARGALLDALEALDLQRDAVIVVGAQAIYLHTGAVEIALAEATKDSDLVIDPRNLNDDPQIERAMTSAGFHRDQISPQPGAWLSPNGIPVDLMVPESLAGGTSRRSVRIPPHANHSARRTYGLEAAIVDHQRMLITALLPDDHRQYSANIASPAALLIAKLHKLGERADEGTRLQDKDAHDIYRLLVAIPTVELVVAIRRLSSDPVAGVVTSEAMQFLRTLFVDSAAIGSTMAGRAEEGIGDPELVSAAAAVLANDLLGGLD